MMNTLVIILIHVIIIPIVLITLVFIAFALTLSLAPLLLADTPGDAFALLLQALLLHTPSSATPPHVLPNPCPCLSTEAIQSGLCWRVQKKIEVNESEVFKIFKIFTKL